MKEQVFQYLTILIIVLGLCSISSCQNSTEPKIISISDAEENILTNVLNGNDAGKIIYELPEMIKSGSSIKCRGLDSTDFIATSDSWFFFIDDQPDYYWVHNCRYVFVDVLSEKLTIHEWTYFPTCLNEMKIIDF